MEDKEQIKRQEVRDALGPALCLAKWNQVTIHLGTGLTHSCHHPGAHKIVEKEVLRNPMALHNTMHKKKCWREMLEGKRPKECDYCWRIEDNSPMYSDRIFKSSEPWAWPSLDKIKNSDWLEDYNPTYVELSFSNRCNYKCLYCSPNFSSRWNQEAKEFGPVDLGFGTVLNYPIDSVSEERCNHVDKNILVEAFWKWWPELFKGLHTFRLTGGEPLLVDETYQVLSYIQEHWSENPNLNLALNTNLGMTDKQFDRFLDIADDLSNNSKVREFILFTSIESMGKEAEYVRYGLETGKFWERVEKLLERLPKLTLTIMATYNILSVFSFDQLIDKVYDLKKKYQNNERVYGTAVTLDTSYLRWPDPLSIKVATDYEKSLIKASGEKIESLRTVPTDRDWHEWPAGFSELEIEKVKRIYDYVTNDQEPFDSRLKRRQLKAWLEEADRRRGTNYKETFLDLHL